MTTPVGKPPGDAQLFDHLHVLFGIGDYNDDDPKPWYRFRMLEIGKIKALRKKRGLSVDDLWLTADFCSQHDITIAATWRLIPYIVEAKRARREWGQRVLEREVANAVSYERSLLDSSEPWIERLLLARGPYRTEVLEHWRKYRAEQPTRKARP